MKRNSPLARGRGCLHFSELQLAICARGDAKHRINNLFVIYFASSRLQEVGLRFSTCNETRKSLNKMPSTPKTPKRSAAGARPSDGELLMAPKKKKKVLGLSRQLPTTNSKGGMVTRKSVSSPKGSARGDKALHCKVGMAKELQRQQRQHQAKDQAVSALDELRKTQRITEKLDALTIKGLLQAGKISAEQAVVLLGAGAEEKEQSAPVVEATCSNVKDPYADVPGYERHDLSREPDATDFCSDMVRIDNNFVFGVKDIELGKVGRKQSLVFNVFAIRFSK